MQNDESKNTRNLWIHLSFVKSLKLVATSAKSRKGAKRNDTMNLNKNQKLQSKKVHAPKKMFGKSEKVASQPHQCKLLKRQL